jgi:hypothetical protein
VLRRSILFVSSNISFEMSCICARSTGIGSGGSVLSAAPNDPSAKPGIGHQVDTLIPQPGLPPEFPVSAIR